MSFQFTQDEQRLSKRLRGWGYRAGFAAANAGLRPEVPPTYSFARPEGGFACTDLKYLQTAVGLAGNRKLDAEGLRDDYLRQMGQRGFIILEDKYILTITTAFERYRADAGKKRCVASYLDPTLIEVETSSILPIGDVDWASLGQKREESSKAEAEELIRENSYQISGKQLRDACKEGLPHLSVDCLDKKFWATDKATMQTVVDKALSVQNRVYVPERFDCDDFATSFKADLSRLGVTAVGFVLDYSSSHAYNAVVLVDAEQHESGAEMEDCLSVVAVEPQQGKIVQTGAGSFKALQGRNHLLE